MIWVEFPDDKVGFDFERVAGIMQRETYTHYICDLWEEDKKCPDSSYQRYEYRNVCKNPEHKRKLYRTEVILSSGGDSLWVSRSFSDVMLVVDAVKRELDK